MQILMLTWEFPPRISGGLGTACEGFSRALASAGHEVTVVVPGLLPGYAVPGVRVVAAAQRLPQLLHVAYDAPYPYPGPGPVGASEVEVGDEGVYEMPPESGEAFRSLLEGEERPPCTSYGSAATLYRDALELLLPELAPDVIYAHDWMTIPGGILARRRTGAPLVFHVHSLESDRAPGVENDERRRIEKEGVFAADRIVAVSKYTRRCLMHDYERSAGNIDVVYCAVPEFPEPHEPTRQDFPLPPGPLVSCIGRLAVQKGQTTLIRAVALLRREYPDIRVILGGRGPMLHRIVELIGASSLQIHVHVPGFLERRRVAAVLALSDVAVFPSLSEPYGLAALEAAAADVPVILSRNSGAREVLTASPLVSPGNESELAARLEEMLASPDYRREIATKNRAAINVLSWQRGAEALTKIFQRARDGEHG